MYVKVTFTNNRKWNNIMITNIIRQLGETAAIYPDKVMFSDENMSLTFSQVLDKAKRLGSALVTLSEGRCPIAVMSSRCALTPAIFLGIVYAGCFYAPMDSTQPEKRLKNILGVLEPQLLIADRANVERARSLGYEGTILVAEELFKNSINEKALAARQRSACMDDPLYVIFTSGSTGVPKGVITSELSLCTYITSYAEVMGIDDSDILGNQSPLDYIAAIRDIYLPIFTGASTYIIPKQCFVMPAELFKTLNEQKITAVGWSVSVFTIAVKVGAFESGKPEYLKKVCFSGSVMPGSVLRVWQKNLRGAKFVNQYGPTECTASCTYYEVEGLAAENEVLPIGRPYGNYRVFLLGEDNSPTPTNGLGEICVSGVPVALGYYNNPEQTAKSFMQNPLNKAYAERIFKTGDYGVMLDSGLLMFRGRKDRQIKHLGHRVELSEIESAALGLDNVSDSCAMYYKEKELIYLFYTGTATVKETASALREILPGFMVPRKFIQLDEMPRLANGKTDMEKLKEYFK